ncbi:unnamed protein product [Sphagnum compactum]
MALRAATTLGLLLPPPSQHERITRSCERSSSSRFSYVCRRAPSRRTLAVDRTSSSSSASTSTAITATGKLVENEKNEIKKKKKEEEERENRNGALFTSTTLERNEDNRLPGLMNVESFAKDTITSDVVSVHDYMEQVPFFLGDDGGPPRWFCPVFCSPLTDDAPLLLFLPGMDGTGLGLVLHHESLRRMFEVRCLHIPVHDRTPFEGLLNLVEDSVLMEMKQRPTGPIYLVGDSFGGALALSVAARNPTLDLVLILANPATSFDRSQLQPLFPLLQATPSEVFTVVPYLLSFIMGDPLRMAAARVQKDALPPERALQMRESLLSLLPTLPTLVDVVPKEALLWKLKMLHSAALYTNSRLHAIRAEVLVLASGKDQMLPSAEEAKRLKKAIPGCRVRYFKESGHTLLLEGDLNLGSVIKSTGCYRRGKTWDPVTDYVMLTRDEYSASYNSLMYIRQLLSPVFFSTSDDGEVEQGLSNIPTDRPVLFVGNHLYFGVELSLIVGELLKQRNLLVRGLAHPFLFKTGIEEELQEPSMTDLYRTFGAVPVSGKVMFKLMKNGYSTLLYPGGAREALHRKGETHKLFWPEKSEFVRMAARFGCTIIPISSFGEDEILDVVLDLNDLRRIPFGERLLIALPQIRTEAQGEVADQPIHFPFLFPKLNPGRLYFLFGKPIYTAGRREELQDREKSAILYEHVKSEVARGLDYLRDKRDRDPYRQLLPSRLLQSSGAENEQIPTFTS